MSANGFMTVLIVDADSLFAAQAQAALENAGLAVVVRDDAPLDTLRKLRPAVLVVNAELPKSSGYSICNRLRRDKELAAIPILLTSAEASRIEPLVEALQMKARQWTMVHPGQTAPGIVIFAIDERVHFQAIKKVMISVAAAGYIHISFAVNKTGGE